MIRSPYSFIIMLSLISAGCASSGRAETDVLKPHKVGGLDDGADVRVKGYLAFEFHARQLWSSKADARRNNILRCVTLVGTRPHQEVLKRKSGSITTIRGKAYKDVTTGHYDVGACNRVGVLVEAVEE